MVKSFLTQKQSCITQKFGLKKLCLVFYFVYLVTAILLTLTLQKRPSCIFFLNFYMLSNIFATCSKSLEMCFAILVFFLILTMCDLSKMKMLFATVFFFLHFYCSSFMSVIWGQNSAQNTKTDPVILCPEATEECFFQSKSLTLFHIGSGRYVTTRGGHNVHALIFSL